MTGVACDDSVDDGEPETRPPLVPLRREERLEDAGSGRVVHSHAGVGNPERDERRGRGCRGCPALREARLDSDLSLVADRVPGVHVEVHQHLLKLGGISFDRREIVGEIEVDRDSFGKGCPEQGDGVVDDRVDRNASKPFLLAPSAEREELPHESGPPVHGRLDRLGGERVGRRPRSSDPVDVAGDDGQDVVEVVSDAAGEASHAFELLRLQELFGKEPALRDVAQVPLKGRAPGRPVAAHDAVKPDRLSVVRAELHLAPREGPFRAGELPVVRRGVGESESGDFGDGASDEVLAPRAQEPEQERIHVEDLHRLLVDEKNSFARGFEDPPVTGEGRLIEPEFLRTGRQGPGDAIFRWLLPRCPRSHHPSLNFTEASEQR